MSRLQIITLLALLNSATFDFAWAEEAETGLAENTEDGPSEKAKKKTKTKDPESHYFCRKIFSGILLEKIGKNHATVYAFGAPIRPRHLVSTQQGDRNIGSRMT
ncbi:MAG: hypothetical protein KGZ69_01195 [Methylomonas sp.]|nr:hypothetical protein [Methylomonas sp.]